MGRVEYRGASFSKCSVYEMLFDHDTAQQIQTITAAVMCPEYPVRIYMEAPVVLASDLNKDIVGQYYGYDMDMQKINNENPRDYRRAVFGILDVLSTDSVEIILQQHLATQVVSITLAGDVTSESNISFHGGAITYQNGTVTELSSDNHLAEAEIYRASITNIMLAVHHAVELDLGNPGPGNIFINPAAVNETFSPNVAPARIDPNRWTGNDTSFAYGYVSPPYQTWAQMVRAGLPKGLPLGNLTGLPSDSTMLTNYLCPIYQLKPTGTLLANVFIGTATMFLSVWAAWMTLSAIVAKRMKGPCITCNCRNPTAPGQGHAHSHHHNHDQELGTPRCGVHTELERDTMFTTEKSGLDNDIQELPKTGPATGATKAT
ncbi:unnamed protein product [Rhizoctonia solani]|uniref:Uncharacterized protein n=1 Tax=Rhizoctonia solani TaxID=456999 RepID=A0A8H3H8P9_9AGAM|nr:unnamed protein product [Rhizoctonia solani]